MKYSMCRGMLLVLCGEGWVSVGVRCTWACAGFVTAGCWRKIVCVQVERSERSERSVLTAWSPGARSRAPGGVQGQRPGGGAGGRAPGSSWVFRVFQTPKRLSSHSFSFILKTSFSAKSFDVLRYKMIIIMIRAHSLFSDIGFFIIIQRRGSGFDIGVHRGSVWGWCAPLEKLDSFFF